MRSQGLEAAQPRRKDPAPPSRPPGPGLAPRPGPAGLPPPTGRESRWVGDITYIRTWEGIVYLATVPGCCTKKAVEYAIGATARGTESVICEAIDMAARRYPYTTGETILLPQAGAASTPPSSSATTWRATALALRWAGPGCAGRVPGRKSADATLKEREGLSDGVSHKKQGHPGYCLLDRVGIQSETTPLRPGVQDAQRGRGGAPSSKTSSLKDRFQSCPRHARQPRLSCSSICVQTSSSAIPYSP